MTKPNIDVAGEYDAATMPQDPMQPAAEEPQDIEVSAEQMTIMKQLATDGKFEELGRLVAGLITPTPMM